MTNAAAIQKAVDAEVKALGLRVDCAKIPERYALTWFEEATKQDEAERRANSARSDACAIASPK